MSSNLVALSQTLNPVNDTKEIFFSIFKGHSMLLLRDGSIKFFFLFLNSCIILGIC